MIGTETTSWKVLGYEYRGLNFALIWLFKPCTQLELERNASLKHCHCCRSSTGCHYLIFLHTITI